jgi:mono/diheme cytochrome c family protein
MQKRLLLIVLAAAFTASVGYANQSNPKVTILVNKTAPTNGKLMYASYCASCHGVDGRGHGPIAAELKTPPTDLTLESRNNHGRFPDSHIVCVLQFGAEIPSRRSAEMPVWGPILAKMNVSNPQYTLLRISNLSRYLETLQVK